VLCAGKVYYDLLEKRREQKLEHVALVRIEQLYPYPEARLTEILRQYSNLQQLIGHKKNQKIRVHGYLWFYASIS
jgi:2-oxoglutarate dehydrogenase E1 component